MDIKNIDWAATDALCFDMDGTLWDAVDSYCEIWNRCFRKVGMDRVVARQELIACMGLNLHEILRRLCGGVPSCPRRGLRRFLQSFSSALCQ